MGNQNGKSRSKSIMKPTSQSQKQQQQLFQRAAEQGREIPLDKQQLELEKLFNVYKEDENTIGGDGVVQFCEALGVEVMGIFPLIIMWKLNVKEKFKISRSEFVEGFSKLSLYSLSQIKAILPKWNEELQSQVKTFKMFYNFVFQYSKDSSQKVLPLNIAIPTWKVVLTDCRHCKWGLAEWCTYVEEEYKKPITKDIWEQLFAFFTEQNLHVDLSNYDKDSAWPIAIDEFVEHLKARRRNSNSSK